MLPWWIAPTAVIRLLNPSARLKIPASALNSISAAVAAKRLSVLLRLVDYYPFVVGFYGEAVLFSEVTYNLFI